MPAQAGIPSRLSALRRGSVILTLPLFIAAGLRAELLNNQMIAQGLGSQNSSASQGGLEADWTDLFLNKDVLNLASAQAGYPGTGASGMQLWGGGVMVEKGQARYGLQAMTGQMAASNATQFSNWGLDMVGLLAEQRYPSGTWEATAGFYVGYGQFDIEYRGPSSVFPSAGGYSNFESRFISTGSMAGLRWPTTGSMSFFIRAGYFWIPAAGAWHGDLAGQMPTTYFSLNAPFSQGGLALKF